MSGNEHNNTTRLFSLTKLAGAAVLAALLCASSGRLLAQAKDQTAAEKVSDRKVLTRVEPEYPETLKRLYIGGVVRVETVVAPDGKVESTKLLGGSPILGQAAMKAIKQWKYAKAPSKETLVVRWVFDPHQ